MKGALGTLILGGMLALPLGRGVSQAKRSTAPSVAAQRRAYETIKREFPSYRSISFDLNHAQVDGNGPDEGGDVVAYCKGDSVRLIVLNWNTERSDGVRRYYVERDSIFYILDGSTEGGPYTQLYFVGPKLVRWIDVHGRLQPVDDDHNANVVDYPEYGYSLLKAMRGCRIPPPYPSGALQ